MTVPLFGGRRAIRVRAGSRSFASGVDTLAEMPMKDCRVVIEAGELRPESPLRKACERAKTAVAIGCYPDTERDLAKLIDDELRLSSLRISPDARATLMALLGGDRQASRNELRKLTLYAHGKGEVTLDDVMAVVADASELKLDPVVDGAFAGKPVNAQAVEAMLKAITIPVQLGGGIRDLGTVEAWLDKGITRVIIGTAAVRDPELVKRAAKKFPGRVAVGLDARDGKVAVEGWAETSQVTALEIARRFEDAGVAAIIFTDIARDGLLKGLNLDATIALAEAISIPVIASGGLASIEDVRAMLAPRAKKLAGAIAGRALYDGRLDPSDALALIRKARAAA
jgi:phosphoribosylformimino-5-aminoimidazole carboxamide ribotide isomerase